MIISSIIGGWGEGGEYKRSGYEFPQAAACSEAYPWARLGPRASPKHNPLSNPTQNLVGFTKKSCRIHEEISRNEGLRINLRMSESVYCDNFEHNPTCSLLHMRSLRGWGPPLSCLQGCGVSKRAKGRGWPPPTQTPHVQQ